MHAKNSRRCWKRRLLTALVAGSLAPALALAAAAGVGSGDGVAGKLAPARSFGDQVFQVYGRAEWFRDGRRITTPILGTLHVDPDFVDPRFGIVGRITSVAVHLPVLPEVSVFDRVLVQGPEISGITPLKYDVNLVNAQGGQIQFQFTTVQSPEVFPGSGTPMGSLVNFQGGSFMQGSNSGALSLGGGQPPIYLQNFSGRIVPAHRGGRQNGRG